MVVSGRIGVGDSQLAPEGGTCGFCDGMYRTTRCTYATSQPGDGINFLTEPCGGGASAEGI